MKLHSNSSSPSSKNTGKRPALQKLKFESTQDAARLVINAQSHQPIHALRTTEQLNLATAHYILATQAQVEQDTPSSDSESESCEQVSKFHLNSAIRHLSQITKKTKIWRDQIVYTYFKRAELQEQQSHFNHAALDYREIIRIFQEDPTPNPIDIPTDIKLIALQSAVTLSDLILSGDVTHPAFQSQSIAFEYLQFALRHLDSFPELTRSFYVSRIRRRKSRFPFDDLQAPQDYLHTCTHAYQLAGLYFSSPSYHNYQPETAKYYFNKAIHCAYQLLPYGHNTHYLETLYQGLTSWYQLPIHSLAQQASATYYWILGYLFSTQEWPMVDPIDLEDVDDILANAEIEFRFFQKRCLAISRPIKTIIPRMTLVHFIDGLNFMLEYLEDAAPNQIIFNWLPAPKLKKLLHQLIQKALLELFEYDHPHSKSLTISKPHTVSQLIALNSFSLDQTRSRLAEITDKN